MPLGRPFVAGVAWLLFGVAGCGSEVTIGPGGAGAQGSTPTTVGTGGSTTASTTSAGAAGGGAVTSSTTGSTSTVTGTTTTTTTTWGPGLCDVHHCQTCLDGTCTASVCNAETASCDDNAECGGLRDCLDACYSETICIAQCKQMYPSGYDALVALETCELCVACFGDCVGAGQEGFCPIVL